MEIKLFSDRCISFEKKYEHNLQKIHYGAHFFFVNKTYITIQNHITEQKIARAGPKIGGPQSHPAGTHPGLDLNGFAKKV